MSGAPRLFGTDGIRGIPGQAGLAAETLERVGRALADAAAGRLGALEGDDAPHPLLPDPVRSVPGAEGAVLVAHDGRASAPESREPLTAGLVAGGARVLDCGLLPTPGLGALVPAAGAALGLVLSASHNPAEHNGVKVVGPRGLKLSRDAERRIESDAADAATKPGPGGGWCDALPDAEGHYVRMVVDAHGRPDGGEPPLRGLHLVVDAANGAASRVAPRIFEALGARVTAVGCDPDGLNINEGVGAMHTGHCADAVREHGADLGLSLDGDGDRVLPVDADGRVHDGDTVLHAMARGRQASGEAFPGPGVVLTVMSNLGVIKAFERMNVATAVTPVGDRNVTDELRRRGWALGGEPSGHTIVVEEGPSGDGIRTGLRLVEALRRLDLGLADTAGEWRRYPQESRSVPVDRKPPLEECAGVQSALAAVEEALGDDGRVVLRYSGTEPICRVMVEAAEADTAASHADTLAAAVAADVGEGP